MNTQLTDYISLNFIKVTYAQDSDLAILSTPHP